MKGRFSLPVMSRSMVGAGGAVAAEGSTSLSMQCLDAIEFYEKNWEILNEGDEET